MRKRSILYLSKEREIHGLRGFLDNREVEGRFGVI